VVTKVIQAGKTDLADLDVRLGGHQGVKKGQPFTWSNSSSNNRL